MTYGISGTSTSRIFTERESRLTPRCTETFTRFALQSSVSEIPLVRHDAALYIEGVVPQSTMLDLESHEQGPPVPPGEPTALNKERAGQCDEVLRHGLDSARIRGSRKSHPG